MIKVFNIETDNQDMKTIILINDDAFEHKAGLVDGFLASRNLAGELHLMSSAVGKTRPPSLSEFLAPLRSGDLLVIGEVTILGNTFSAVMHELVHLFERGIGLGIADVDVLIEAKGVKGREYARMIALIAELFKRMNSRKTKTALAAARQHGKRIGRPSGLSRLDGKEGEIREYLEKRVSKSAIARILGASRANLAQFIVARRLEVKDSREGGPSHARS